MNTSQTLPLTDLSACCSLGTGPLSDNQAERYAELFKVLADPTRLHILAQLGAGGCGPVTVGELTDILGIAQPMVSHHLKKLVDAGLITRHVTSPVHRAADLDDAVAVLTGVLAPGDVVFTLGAGDITTLGPRIVADPALGSGPGGGPARSAGR